MKQITKTISINRGYAANFIDKMTIKKQKDVVRILICPIQDNVDHRLNSSHSITCKERFAIANKFRQFGICENKNNLGTTLVNVKEKRI